MIGILDYGMGNLRSVQKAFEAVDAPRVVILSDPGDMVGCEKIVLPGVGNFADGIAQLSERKLAAAVKDFAATGKPLLGICLGMQLLLSASTEDAEDGEVIAGLGLIPGQVVRFREDQGPGRPRLKVPHMGWNRLKAVSGSPLFRGVQQQPGDFHAYFVHGYFCRPDDERAVAATAEYGHLFCAAMHHQNIWAMQFHPEKSQKVGLQMLRNFAAL